jgi:hypothetical protein
LRYWLTESMSVADRALGDGFDVEPFELSPEWKPLISGECFSFGVASSSNALVDVDAGDAEVVAA